MGIFLSSSSSLAWLLNVGKLQTNVLKRGYDGHLQGFTNDLFPSYRKLPF